MRTLVRCFAVVILIFLAAPARGQALQDPLLDHMTGQWILQGTIAGQQTVHDIDAQWVLAHQYIQVHEVSREKDAKGHPANRSDRLHRLGCAVESVFVPLARFDRRRRARWQRHRRAKRGGDQLAFLFLGTFHTTFIYDKTTDSWQWTMDDEEKGKLVPFARVKLARKS